MSKTLGNTIDPMAVAEKYGVDALRYVLLRHCHPFEDSDLTLENIHEYYTANLVNGLGNLVARVMQLAEKNLEKPIEHPQPTKEIGDFFAEVTSFEFNRLLDTTWVRIQLLDKKITDEEPFKVIKTEPEKGRKMIGGAVSELYTIARMLQPFMPATSGAIKAAILANKKPENLFPRIENV